MDTDPTSEELGDLSLACNKLWELDSNRLVPGEDYEINLQRSTRVFRRDDAAPEPLFTRVNEEVFERPTFKAFVALLDNYERETGVQETVTNVERKENWDFINAVLDTVPMQYAHKYLVEKGVSPAGIREFARQLYVTWFELYRRETRNDSSGFEHVFVGEERNGQIIGFHNWVQFYLEEKKGTVDYHGYILPRKRGRGHQDQPDGDEQLITLQFAWLDENDGSNDTKPVSSTLIGCSPEFEMALYTMCFLTGEENNMVHMGHYDMNIKCYRINSRAGPKLGTAFPEAL